MSNWQIPDLDAFILIFVIWEAFWKAIGLWKAAKRGDLIWFIAIFVINLFGLVPLFYLWRTKQLKETINSVLKFLRLKKL